MKRKVGVWLIGAYGNVSTCAVAGAAAITRGLTDKTGLVTEGPGLGGLDLVGLSDLVFGGHEIRSGSFIQSAKEFGDANGLLTPELRRAVAPELRRADSEVRPGLLLNPSEGVSEMASPVGPRAPLHDEVERLKADLVQFRDRNRLDSVVVVNLCSTEPLLGPSKALASLADLRASIARDDSASIPSSVLYAVAALESGCPFLDFTPAVATATAPMRELAELHRLPQMGRDGKTGETLLKTVLAPMFVARHLRVMSWEGHNMLGNRDGAVLRGADASASKVQSKDEALRRILGNDERLHSQVRIDYVPSLNDWKQAYDFIHFEGFLGARMQMHFLWQGCDSALAAPLVLDLVRLVDLAHRRGEKGALPQLACFFKSPVGVDEQDFARQMDALYRYAAQVRADNAASRLAGA